MRKFQYNRLKEKNWDNEIVNLIGAIYRYMGKQELYIKQHPQHLDALVELAKIQSTEASNAIEGIRTTSTRLKELVEEKTTPRNRDEAEIIGYRDALNLIHNNFDIIPITPNYILQLHKIMYSHMNNPMAGKPKSNQNYISATHLDGSTEILFTPLAPFETMAALEEICQQYNLMISKVDVDPLLLIPVFIHDFLCIHPFNDGNGRMSRLLTTLLLYQNGFLVGKYISLEAKIAANKDIYYHTLGEAGIDWHEGKEDITPFLKYFLQIILAGYQDFEERFTLVNPKQSALETVREATQKLIGRFTKKQLHALCPHLSTSSIESSLRKLIVAGEITREGAGPATKYYRNF